MRLRVAGLFPPSGQHLAVFTQTVVVQLAQWQVAQVSGQLLDVGPAIGEGPLALPDDRQGLLQGRRYGHVLEQLGAGRGGGLGSVHPALSHVRLHDLERLGGRGGFRAFAGGYTQTVALRIVEVNVEHCPSAAQLEHNGSPLVVTSGNS